MPEAMAQLTEDRVILPDGRERRVLRWRPTGHPHCQVLALHAFGNHAGLLGHAAAAISRAGATVLAYDQRGFADDRQKGRWPGHEKLSLDVASVTHALQSENPELPLVLLGESMGGSLALHATAVHAINAAGLVLATPGVLALSKRDRRWKRLLWLLKSIHSTMGVNFDHRTGFMSPDSAALFDGDPLIVRFASVGDYYGLIELAQAASEAAGAVSTPSLLLYGLDDEIIPEMAINRTEASLADHCTRIDYPGGPHPLLHWRGRDRVVRDIVGWLSAHGWAASP